MRNNRTQRSKSTLLTAPHEQGFTLLEIMVVVIVMGVMLSLVIPRLSELGEANLKQSARHLTGMIRFLHDEAQAKKAVFKLRFDVQGGRYWVEIFDEPSREFKRYHSDMTGEGSLSGQTSFRDVQAGSHPDDPSILFTPDGWVEQAFIHLKDGDDKPFTLIVKPLMGDTELRDGYVEAQ